jgi:SHS2 domain-containing protein
MEMLTSHLRLRELWIGADFALGRGREGDVSRLRELGLELGYEVQVIDAVGHAGSTVSSTRIRALLEAGDVEGATHLMGRYPTLSGMVVAGAGRGRRLGFTTANLEVRPDRAVLADGVYAVFAVLGRERLPGVANIGVRPSFDNGDRNVEVHILDFDRDIYGCDLAIEFVSRLRPERRFSDVDELAAQIARDCWEAAQILQSQTPPHRQPPIWTPTCHYRFREVEHTADRALWVQGDELKDLFAGATRGMYHLMADLDGLMAIEWRKIHLQSWDQASLLVDWLNELLFLTDVEGLVLVETHIESLEATELVGRVGGLVTPLTGAHIKAATYHDLELVQGADGWTTVITFDV